MAGKFIRFFSPFVRVMPEIKQPAREVSFKEKFIWTAVVLIIYIIMSNIPLYGVQVEESADYFYWLRVILASQRGTLTELGIGPIVTAGLIMQLLLGSKLINVNMADPYDRSMFSGAQKVLAMFLTMFNAVAYLIGGAFGPTDQLGIGNAIFILIQLLFSGIIIILLDELLQKGWGLGSGVSLFIAAGVAGQMFWNAFSFLPVQGSPLPRGIVIAFFTAIFDGDPTTNLDQIFLRGQLPSILGGITTIIIFVVVVWFESTRVEIPLQYRGYRGFKGKYPMKLLYVSNIPVILVNALYANFLFFGQLIAGPDSALRGGGFDFWLDLIGTFERETGAGTGAGGYLNPTWGLIYFLSPPQGIDALLADPLRSVIYLGIFVMLCIMLGRVWVEVSGLAPRDIAGQILDSGMQIPGFRSSEKIIERILKRYIPTLVILNGFIIAFLSFFADSLGALTSGTGLLIAIGITHQYAETISKELAAAQYPGMRGLLGLD
ncbi:MAG: preprotein translocase subunit SecY [Candidatus Lokiarchaeota archaeon]|nr:preprotein translocase subunit SecY [Candidatus Lokiarchaeota archaeon]MBD3200687.1 preprotein translocase subunit SecY [Candidatus Lokiarchaeota archaeon]